MDMKELVEAIAKALVDNPNEVQVRVLDGQQTTVFELRVMPEDIGKVIGKQGRTAAALRTLASVAGEQEGKSVTLEIRDTPYKG